MPWDALTIQILEGSCLGMPCHSKRVKWYHMHIALEVVVVHLSQLLLSVESLVPQLMMMLLLLKHKLNVANQI